MHLAVLSGFGAPLVAKLVRRDARVSASFNDPPRAFIVHGTAVEAREGDSTVAEYGELMRRLYVELYGRGRNDWFDGLDHDGSFTGHIEPRVTFAKG